MILYIYREESGTSGDNLLPPFVLYQIHTEIESFGYG